MLYINSNDQGDEVDVNYDDDGLRYFKQAESNELGVILDTVHCQFFTKPFARLFVFLETGKLRFEFIDNCVKIRGGREYLESLLYNMDVISSGAHFHLDNYEDHPLLDESCDTSVIFNRI